MTERMIYIPEYRNEDFEWDYDYPTCLALAAASKLYRWLHDRVNRHGPFRCHVFTDLGSHVCTVELDHEQDHWTPEDIAAYLEGEAENVLVECFEKYND